MGHPPTSFGQVIITLVRIGIGFEEKILKFLVVLHNESLTWKQNMNHINIKISKLLLAIKEIKNIFNTECLKTLYFALIQLHVNYATKSILKRTAVLQKRTIRTTV